MTRLALASVCALCCALVAFSADPELSPVEKKLVVQTAMETARKHLDTNAPAEAVVVLEKELSNADGARAYLNLLREAYTAELSQLEKAPGTDPARITQTQRKLALLGGQAPKPEEAKPQPAPVPAPDLGPSLAVPTPSNNPWSDSPTGTGAPQPPPAKESLAKTEDAIAAFKTGDFAEADKLFTRIGLTSLTSEQKTAWAYCKIKLAADRVNSPTCDANTAATAAQEVSDALEFTTDNAKLLATGQQVLKIAQTKAKASGTGTSQPPLTKSNGDVIETASFRVSAGGNREFAEAVAKTAEASRKQIFERWSGPPGGDWQPKCDIVIHATAESYAKATGKSAKLTGHATVRLTNNLATERRIDLRADDDTLIENTLPRELTHVILADMFADKPPPKWAQEGMAILAGSPDEISRYSGTLARCADKGELQSLSALFTQQDFPADKITGFYCQSVSVTEYLVKLKGERNFKIFLSAAQRYGVAKALQQQYNIDGPQALEAAWKRAYLP